MVLVARAPSPRIDKEYRAALRAKSPSSSKVQQSSVRQAYYMSPMSQTVRSGVTSPFDSEAYYGETDSDADVAAHDRQRKQKRRSPSNSPGKAGYTSPDMGEASEMSGYDSAPDAQGYTRMGFGSQEGTLTGVVRREVVYQPHPSGAWSSQTSTETSSMSADEQSSQDLVLEEEDNGLQELANVPLVSPERAKGALRLGSRSHLVPMVGPVEKPVDEELTKTYMDKAKQASEFLKHCINQFNKKIQVEQLILCVVCAFNITVCCKHMFLNDSEIRCIKPLEEKRARSLS